MKRWCRTRDRAARPNPPRWTGLAAAVAGTLGAALLAVAATAGTAIGVTAGTATGTPPATASGPNADDERTPRRFSNPYAVPEDTGARPAPSYFLRRAWVQITRDLAATEVPPTQPLDLAALERRPFALSWLGHSAMLMRVGGLWVLFDPVLTDTAGPLAGLGPARLTALPIGLHSLPRIDVVLTSHDHYDHLDRPSVRQLARQPGGPPRFFVGRGLVDWFRDEAGAQAEAFDWWQSALVGGIRFTFVPAQHNSGRGPLSANRTLWGGWVVEHAVAGTPRRFYFAGDTAYVQPLFQDIRARIGPIDLAALPIGAYQPRPLMRFEHTDPDEAVRAFQDLGAARAFGVHWGTFQLGDEEPFQPARDLAAAVRQRGAAGFGLMPIGAVLDVAPPAAGAGAESALQPPDRLQPVSAAASLRGHRP